MDSPRDQFILAANKRSKKKLEIPEIDIENAYCNHAKRKSCFALKLTFINKRGWPDRTTLCHGGRILFIEFKRKGKPQKATQKLVQRLLESYGFKYYVCDYIGQAETHLDKFLNEMGST